MDESEEAIKQPRTLNPSGYQRRARFPLPALCHSENKKRRFLTEGSVLHHFFCSVFLFFFFIFFVCLYSSPPTWLLSRSEAIKPVTHIPDRSRPSSVKCVGHFGSVRAGGTQSNCSLEGECDRASLPSTRRVRLPHPNRVKERREADGGDE